MRDREQVERATQAVEAHLRVTAFRTRKQVEADIRDVNKRMDKTLLRGFIDPSDVKRYHQLRAELALIEQKESGNA